MTPKLLQQLDGVTYMPHQETAIRWMMTREEDAHEFIDKEGETHYVYGGILADEMGLGKTISVIGLMLNNQVPRTLVVGPVAVLGQWGDIAAKAGFTVFKQMGSVWDPVSVGSKTSDAIYLVNYERILANPSATHEFTWDRIVMDEAHKARNPSSQVFEQLLAIKSNTRWALTGTPIVNKMRDLVSLYRLIGSNCEKLSSTQALKPLGELMLARNREMIRAAGGTGMPSDPKVTHISLDFASPQEETFYKGIQGSIAAKWASFKYRNDRDATMKKLVLMLRLRQLSVHPQVYIDAMKAKGVTTMPDWAYGCTKFEHVKKMMAEFPEGDGTVIFCSFRSEIEMLRDYLNEDMHCFLYYGGMNEAERAGIIADAKESIEAGQRTVMLVQINSGGTGLNLQFMNRAIFMSPWWTAALMDQAVGRIVRFGQEKKTFVYHIHLKQEETEEVMNIDMFMYKKTEEKRVLCDTILRDSAHDM